MTNHNMTFKISFTCTKDRIVAGRVAVVINFETTRRAQCSRSGRKLLRCGRKSWYDANQSPDKRNSGDQKDDSRNSAVYNQPITKLVRPPIDWLKSNVDATFFEEIGAMSTSCCIRNSS
ncbi:hypothetical protein TSUD_169950 [Trifolium subterraneum]|nr:hypothetical protein TSUD_169950 [Trifolium subterraneum]